LQSGYDYDRKLVGFGSSVKSNEHKKVSDVNSESWMDSDK